ncbi:YciI family protein [Phenylobacterium sp.]|uniref:YciI family protein n=1 Tax=Phenylobacterium sp. TaxID=1871053 RepID=UPI0035B2F7B4
MYVVLLKFAQNKARAPALMEGHKAWIQQGLDDGVFLVVGSLQPAAGGAILAHGASPAELKARVDEDPFVQEDVVSAEILEIAPNRADPRLGFLLG